MILPSRKYSIIYADPPWKFRNKATGGSMISGAESKYKCMALKDVKKLPIADICDKDCFLFLWWIAAMPQEAIDVVAAWGFQLKTMTAFSWIKQTKKLKDHFGMGFYTRQQQEHCLIAVKGMPKVISHSVRQNVRAINEKHSQKPAIARDKIVELCGDLPRIELFARERAVDWDIWGDEINNN